MRPCRYCNAKLSSAVNVYCSNICQSEYAYSSYIEKWKKHEKDGSRGIVTRNLSRHLIRYLRQKYKCCQLCGWDEVHTITKRVPLEVDHIDGNAENNSENNLRLICPNCHALSINYRNLNYGKGREWRRNKYIKT